MKTIFKLLSVFALLAGVAALVLALCRHTEKTEYIPLDDTLD